MAIYLKFELEPIVSQIPISLCHKILLSYYVENSLVKMFKTIFKSTIDNYSGLTKLISNKKIISIALKTWGHVSFIYIGWYLF